MLAIVDMMSSRVKEEYMMFGLPDYLDLRW